MNRKPTSYGDMLKTVAAVSHPDLRPPHRVLLNALATCASQNGENARPTYEYLKTALGVKDTRIGDLLRELRAIGLVDRPHKGQGKDNASIFRLCLENPAYPDDYPTRKFTATKRSSLPPPSTELTATDSEVNRHHVVATILPSHPKRSSNPPSSQTTKNELPSPPEGWWDSPTLAAMGEIKPAQLKQLHQLGIPDEKLKPSWDVEHAWVVLKHAISRWQDRRTKGMEGLREPWRFFFDECKKGKVATYLDESHSLKLEVSSRYRQRFERAMDQEARSHTRIWCLPEVKEEMGRMFNDDSVDPKTWMTAYREAEARVKQRKETEPAAFEDLFSPGTSSGSKE